MAQTKRKRRSKHRGTAAGTVQARGRTSRPGPDAKKPTTAAQRREARLNRQPTWRSAAQRAALASVVIFLVLLLGGGKKSSPASAVLFALVAFAIYVPLGYQFELFLFRRRQRKGLVK